VKRVADMKLLSGAAETITLMDFRKAPGDVIAQVRMGKTFTLTKNGKPVATLSKPEPTALELGAEIRRLGLARE
jgi:antitoxin (DNA-binding transcriptional repressor) of toxin-antitoxin stability system